MSLPSHRIPLHISPHHIYSLNEDHEIHIKLLEFQWNFISPRQQSASSFNPILMAFNAIRKPDLGHTNFAIRAQYNIQYATALECIQIDRAVAN